MIKLRENLRNRWPALWLKFELQVLHCFVNIIFFVSHSDSDVSDVRKLNCMTKKSPDF